MIRGWSGCKRPSRKAIRKKPTLETFWDRNSDLGDKPDYDTWVCPRCNCYHEIDNRYAYCPYCGQRIDWEGIKDEEEEE